jgi:hypothetical protein
MCVVGALKGKIGLLCNEPVKGLKCDAHDADNETGTWSRTEGSDA